MGVCFSAAMLLKLLRQKQTTEDGSGLTQYCIGQILLETGRAREAEAKFEKILSGLRGCIGSSDDLEEV